MATKAANGGTTAAEVDAKLPRKFFVMRGHIMDAFELTRGDMSALVDGGTFCAEYPFGKRKKARFVRTAVMAVARKWEKAE